MSYATYELTKRSLENTAGNEKQNNDSIEIGLNLLSDSVETALIFIYTAEIFKLQSSKERSFHGNFRRVTCIVEDTFSI